MKTQTALSLSLFLVAPLALPVSTPLAQAQNARTLTLTGAVVGRRDANEIWLRSYDRYYRVAGRAPFAIKNGDRIRVSGAWNGGVLTGYSWKPVQILPAVIRADRSVDGEVFRDLPGDEFQVKTLGGSIFRVLALKGRPAGLSRGDLVSAIGDNVGGVLLATNVIVTTQREAITPAPAYRPHQAVIGTVASDPKGNIFEIKTNRGTDRVVALFGETPGVKSGARVRIWAFWDAEQGLWQASNLRVLSGNARGIGAKPSVTKPYGPNYRPPVLSGTIVAGSGAQWTVRAGGNNYPIQLLVAKPALFTIGSKVKLTGIWRGGTMRVNKIERA